MVGSVLGSARGRTALLGGAALALVLSGAARAADAADGGDGGAALEEVVVTAEKRETNLQKTPVAISVMGGEQLADRHVQSLADLMTGGVPSLRIAPFFSRSSALTVGIRGIVPFDANQPSRDAGVGVYIDGVYLGRSQGLGVALFDIERIEVLKGPQGTLFGRNSTGGAVSIVSRKPSGEFGLRQTVGVRNYDGYASETHLDLPAWNDVSLKLDGVVVRRDGTVENPLQGEEDFNRIDRYGVHVGARWRPAATFEAQLDFDYSYDATTPYYVQLIEKNPASAPLAPLVQLQPNRTRRADIGVPSQDSIGKTQGWALHMNWTPMEEVELRSISSYRRLKQSQYDNGIGAHSGPFVPNARFARYSLASLRQEQWSQELQLLGTVGQVSYVGGLYSYRETGDDDAWTPNTLQWNATGTAYTRLPSLEAGASWPFPDRASTAKATSYAAFGQATWTPPVLDERLHLTLGARFTHDKKSGRLFKVNGADTNFTFTFEDDRIDPAAVVAFDATETIHLYGKWGTAYRAGGANSRSVSYRAFGPEEVETLEAGLKSEFWDRRARLNLAAYETRYKDIQIDFSAVNLNNSNRGTLETVNAPGRGKIKGFEIDAQVAPVEGLTLSVGFAQTVGKLPRAANPFAGNRMQAVYIVYTPKNAYTAAIDYAVPLEWGVLKAHLDANIADGYRAMSGEPTLTDDSTIFNARLSLAEIQLRDDVKLQASLWARNLFDEAHTIVESRAGFAFLGAFGIFNEPRTYGLDLTLEF